MLHTHKNSTQNSTQNSTVALVLLTALVAPLAACGGSSSSSPTGALGEVPDTTIMGAVTSAAGNQPVEGSVTQGSRVARGVTADVVSFTRGTGPKDNPTAVVINVNADVNGDADTSLTMNISSAAQSENRPDFRVPALHTDGTTYLNYSGRARGISEAEEDRLRGLLEGPDCSDPDTCLALLGDDGVGEYGVRFVDWTSDNDTYYMGGGHWAYVYATANNFNSDGTLNADVPPNYVLGAFTDGAKTDFGTTLPRAAGTATYNGHSFGSVVTAGNLEESFTEFSARVSLTANFSGGGANSCENQNLSVCGTVSDFSLSREALFSDAGAAANTANLGGVSASIQLLAATYTRDANGNFFRGLTSGTLTGVSDTLIPVAGNWGGSFFGPVVNGGTPAADNTPPGVGGTWGATGTVTIEGVSENFSFIGSFGAKLRP